MNDPIMHPYVSCCHRWVRSDTFPYMKMSMGYIVSTHKCRAGPGLVTPCGPARGCYLPPNSAVWLDETCEHAPRAGRGRTCTCSLPDHALAQALIPLTPPPLDQALIPLTPPPLIRPSPGSSPRCSPPSSQLPCSGLCALLCCARPTPTSAPFSYCPFLLA